MSGQPLLLGVEIDSTRVQLGLGRGDGVLLAIERRRIDRERGTRAILVLILEAIAALRTRVPGALAAAGVGLGQSPDNAWDPLALADAFRSRLGLDTVVIHNQGETAGLGEARFGAGAGVSPVLYVHVDERIGGGLIADGRIYRDAGAGALEIGRIWVVDRTASDQDVLRLEDVASEQAITLAARDFAARQERGAGDPPWLVLQLADGDPRGINAAVVAEAARLGDLEATFILGKAISAMAHALNQAVTLVAPHRIILGGGVSLIDAAQWLDPIRHQLELQVFPPFRGTFDVVSAVLAEDAVLHGALALACDAVPLPAPR